MVRCSGVNLTGTFIMIRSVVRPMLEQGFGRITTGRRWGGRVAPNLAHFSASKWCVIGLTKSLVLKASGSGVTVNVVSEHGFQQRDSQPRNVRAVSLRTFPNRKGAGRWALCSARSDAGFATRHRGRLGSPRVPGLRGGAIRLRDNTGERSGHLRLPSLMRPAPKCLRRMI